MSVLDGLEFRPEGQARPDAPQADTRPAPSLWDTAAASARVEADRVDDLQEIRLARAYEPLIEALVEQGVSRRSLEHGQPGLFGIGTAAGGRYRYDEIWRLAKTRGLEGLPDKREDFDREALRRNGGRDADQDTLARSSGVGAFVAQLGGGMVGSLADPINVYSLPIGGGGSSIAMKILSEGLVNAGVEGLQTAGNARAYGRMGEDYGLGDAAADIGLAFAGGAAIRGGFELAPGAVRAGGKAIDAARLRLNPDKAFADAFGRSIPAHLRTPDESAAINLILRQADVEAASPYVRTYAGDDLHVTKLADAFEAIESGRIPVERPTGSTAGLMDPATSVSRPTQGRLHGGIVGYLETAGIPRTLARGIAAGIEAESRSSHTIVNPTSGAFGIGQWLGPRKKELFRRYGNQPSLQQQLEFLVWELKGGDHGGKSVLGAADEVDALRRYITDFMRPAKGAETTGDLERGMAALGRGEEDLPVGGAQVAEGDSAALIAEEAAIAGERAGLEDPAVDATPAEIAEPVELAREGFTSDTAWRLANDEARHAHFGTDPELDPMVRLRRMVLDRDNLPSLNRPARLAETLGISQREVKTLLGRLAELGEVRQSAGGKYARLPESKGPRRPDDLVRFVARNGGISYDGLGPKARAAGHKGDNLKGTGRLKHFVPGVGPLLRPNGLGLDDMGERLWKAGYFGPPSTTPRPDENAVLAAIEDQLLTGNKRFAFGDDAPPPEPRAEDLDPAAEDRRRDAMFEVNERLGSSVFLEEIEATIGKYADSGLPPLTLDMIEDPEALVPYVLEMINRELDEARADAYFESEDDFYDAIDERLRDAAQGEDRGGRAGGEGSEAGSGDAGAQRPGGRARQDDADAPPQLTDSQADALDEFGLRGDPPENEATARAFDDDAGEGVEAAAESDWHDIRQATEADPNIAARQRQQGQLGAEAPLRAKAEQDGTMGLGLFDAADQPTFDLEEIGLKGTAQEIRAALDAQAAGLEAIRKCMI